MNKQLNGQAQLLLSIRDAAQMLSVSSSSIRRLIARGKLKPVRLWRHLRIPIQQIQKLAQPTELGGSNE